MAFAELDAMIHHANTNNSHLISIFLDLENAFPQIWQHHILQTLHNFGLCGHLPSIHKITFKNLQALAQGSRVAGDPPLMEDGSMSMY